MSGLQPAAAKPTAVSRALARDRLGVPAVLFFVLAGVAPLTVAAGVIPTAYATTGLTGIPAAFVLVAVILAVWATGYVAMTRHITNSGAFYAFIARGIGRPVGVAAALVALVAYSFLQVGLYGAFGPTAASEAAAHLGLHAAWWVWALGAWAVITVLGLARVDITGRVLGVLLTVEILVVLAETASGLIRPADGHLSFATLSPAALASAGPGTVGVLAVVAVLGFVGFEQAPVLAEEARHPRRTIPVATYLALGAIAVVYAGAAWAMAAHAGQARVVAAAAAQGPGLLFSLGDGALSQAAQLLFLTSLFAAALAFHNCVWRYIFALGREGVLPAALGPDRSQQHPEGCVADPEPDRPGRHHPVRGRRVAADDGPVLLAGDYGRVRHHDPAHHDVGGRDRLLCPRPTRGERVGTAGRSRPSGDPAGRDRRAGRSALRHAAGSLARESGRVGAARQLRGGCRDRGVLGGAAWGAPTGGVRDDRAGRACRDRAADAGPARDAAMSPRRRPVAGEADLTVVRADAGDLDILSLVIAEAFADLPPSRWLIPLAAARREIFPGYFRLHVEHALADGVVHTTPGRTAAALWLPGGASRGRGL